MGFLSWVRYFFLLYILPLAKNSEPNLFFDRYEVLMRRGLGHPDPGVSLLVLKQLQRCARNSMRMNMIRLGKAYYNSQGYGNWMVELTAISID